jgi:ATP-binding cassette subfamily B protein
MTRRRDDDTPGAAEGEDETDDAEDDEADQEEEAEVPAAFTLGEAAGALTSVWTFCRPFLVRYRREIALIALGVLIETAFNVLMPLSLKVLVDDVFVRRDRHALLLILGVLGASGLLVSAVAIAYERLDARVGAAIVADIRERLFLHVQDLPTAFHAGTRAGEVLARFSVDMATLEQSVLNAANWAALPMAELIAGLALLFVLNWKLAAVTLLIFPIALVGPRLIAPRAVDASYALKGREAEALGAVHEQIGAITVIKAFGLHAVATGWFRARNREVASAMRRSTFLDAMVERSVAIAVLLLYLFVLAAGAVLAFEGVISVGTFVTFESVFWEISYNVAHVTEFVPVLIEGAGAARHMQELVDEPITIVNRPGAGELPRMREGLSFEGVSFGYVAGALDLDRLTLTIPAGRHVAIVGPSGAGKTTILGLLLRLYEPCAGRITIDGTDIAGVTMDSLRAQMAVVFQDNVLFHGTIRENIRLGRPDARDEDVVAAAKMAELHRFVRSLPRGYDTVVGERGATLSGGQRQRVAIARAIVRDPAILLLDEATSALDQATEAAISTALRGIGAGRTVIFVTHRLTSVTGMDDVVVLDRGRLVQRGTHAELLAQAGLYASLWRAQTRGKAGGRRS